MPVKRKAGQRIVGNLTGPNAQLLWTPAEIEVKSDGKWSERQIQYMVKKKAIAGVVHNGRNILIPRSEAKKLFGLKDHETT